MPYTFVVITMPYKKIQLTYRFYWCEAVAGTEKVFEVNEYKSAFNKDEQFTDEVGQEGVRDEDRE